MRVLLLCSTFHPTIGGAESYALNIAIGLGAANHKVLVVTDAVAGLPPEEPIAVGVTVLRIGRYRERFGAPDAILWEQMQFGLCGEIGASVVAFEPDVIISNSLDLGVQAKLASIESGRPWIATFHEQSPEHEPLGRARMALVYGLLKPNAVIAGSRFFLERAHRYGLPAVCRLIYHGIDTRQFRPLKTRGEVFRHYDIPNDHALIVSCGRLTPRKGFADLIRATSEIRATGRAVTLLIAGSLNSGRAAHRLELQDLVKSLGLGDNVTFDEHLTHDQIPWLLSASDVVVQASHQEGLGLAVLEAMACARPVVTTRIAGISEILTRDGIALAVTPGSPAELAAAIESLLSDREACAQIGARARAHVVDSFSIDRMVAVTVELISGVCEDWR